MAVSKAEISDIAKSLALARSEGKRIAVFGWLARNHNPFTQELSSTGVVEFFEKVNPTPLMTKDLLILHTRFLNHGASKKLIDAVGSHNVFGPINIGIIRKIFKEAGLHTTTESEATVIPPTPKTGRKTKRTSFTLTDDDALRFVELFWNRTGNDPEATLSKFKMTPLLRKVFGQKKTAIARTHLVNEKWLDPVVSEGCKKAGSYALGKRGLGLVVSGEKPKGAPTATPIVVPKSSSGDSLLEQLGELQKLIQSELELLRQKKEIETKLEKVAKAKELLGGIEKLLRGAS